MDLLHRETVALSLYRYITRLSGPIATFLLRRRLAKGKEDPERVDERRGITLAQRPSGTLIWHHCASVGESLSVLPLIEQLSKARGDLHFLVTSGTLTSAQLMAERLPPNAIHQFVPLDHPVYCERFFAHWRPNLGVMIESELWPNLVLGARRHGVRLILANARLSEASLKGWQKARQSIACLLNAFDLILAQDEKSAARFRALGATDVSVPGNLKDDASPLPYDEAAFDALAEQFGARPLWVAASTHEGEEMLVARVHASARKTISDLLTVIVPRHPTRGDSIAEALRGLGLTVAQRSKGQLPTAACDIYLADTLGEIGLFYRLASVALIGGSFADIGGHNPLEAARLDCAILFGPHMYNFEASSSGLLGAEAAIQVALEEELTSVVIDLLSKEPVRLTYVAKAKEVAARSSGVVLRICEILQPLLPPEKVEKPDTQRGQNA